MNNPVYLFRKRTDCWFEMDISVIICTWNNSRRLAITLEALSHCTIPAAVSWELVLVNNNCSDDTDGVVAGFQDKVPLVYVKEPIQGVSRARNAGLMAASGQLILFTDDDITPCPEWISEYWRAYLKRPRGFFFGGPVESEFEGKKPDPDILAVAPESVKGLYYSDQEKECVNAYFIGAGWAAPAEAIKSVGGFDVKKGPNPSMGKVLLGDETDVMQKLKDKGLRAWYLPGARVTHFVPRDKCTLRHIGLRWQAYGHYLSERYGKDIQAGVIRRIPLRMIKRVVKL